MSVRSVRIAYAIPPLLGLLLGFLGLVQVSEDGLVGVSSVVTAASETGAASNADVARSLERVANDHDATIARVVADPRTPTTRRVALVTDAPATAGSTWLDGGYRDFTHSMTTRIRPMADLVHYDTAGPYDVLGDDDARQATIDALVAVGFSVTVESRPVSARLGITGGLNGNWALIASVLLGCGALCLLGTIGAPRRSAVHRLNGRSVVSVVLIEMTEIRVAPAVLAVVTPLAAIVLWSYNRFASLPVLASSVSAFCIVLLLPIVAVHIAGTVMACRVPIATAVRGTRPSGFLVGTAQVARAPAVALLITATSALVGSVAVIGSGSADRDLRAAGEAVQLWVTPDPRPGSGSQDYWNRIGAFAGQALADGDALLAATSEIGGGHGGTSTPVLFVDGTYLRHQQLYAADRSRITASDGQIDVWLPSGSDASRTALVRGLRDWELRDASARQRATIGGGELAASAVYSYPGDASTAAWLDDAVVVVPDPRAVFTADQLGSWLSTGDVVFASSRAAERAVADSGLRREFSAVVAVGQDAAERARHAATAVRTDTAALVGAFAVVVLLGAVGTAAHRRRHGRALFARFAAGWSFVRSNIALLVVEAVLLMMALTLVVNRWWDRRPDGTGQVSALDPIARSAGTAGVLTAGLVIAIAAIDVGLIVWTARRARTTRGRES